MLSDALPPHNHIAKRVLEIEGWYTQELGLKVSPSTRGRILEILLYLEERDLRIEDCRLLKTADERWPHWQNRQPHERLARMIGRTRNFTKSEIFFILPR